MMTTPHPRRGVGALLNRNRKFAALEQSLGEDRRMAMDIPHAAALEALSDPVLLVSGENPEDLTGRLIVVANAAARELFRIPSQGGRLVSSIRNPEVLEAIEQSLFAQAANETIFEPRGVQERIWRVRTTPLEAGGGPQRLALVHFRDETDARRAERSRVDFLANASHELRTPLASLSGFIETLRGHARDDAEAREQFLRIMTVQAERMSRLIDDLMSLSRIELNEHVPPSGSCDLAFAVMDVVDALKPITFDKNVALDLKLPPRGVAEVLGDRHQIIQVAQNLLDNAIKYSPPGRLVGVEVISALTAVEATSYSSHAFDGLPGACRLSLLTPDRARDDMRYVLLRITDSGPGMSREHLPRLAERFYRVEGQKSGERLGTGLGLAIVKHVMNRHRGGMIVESAPGCGAAFSAYFPALSH
jgi:two-component system phosphate regulon sensor histidine kinase PhoR